MLVLELKTFLAKILYANEVAPLTLNIATLTPKIRSFRQYSRSVMSKPIVPTNL